MYVSQACNACRRRKVKCDAAKPCANCLISHIPCAYSHQVRRRGPRVPRASSLETQQNGRYQASTTSRKEPVPKLASCGTGVGEAQGLSPQNPSSALQSPESDETPLTSPENPGLTFVTHQGLGYDSSAIHANLMARVESILASKDSSTSTTATYDVVQRCIDLFFQYMFPNTPIAHERTLRADASVFLLENSPAMSETGRLSHDPSYLTYAKSFTLITALCAFVTSVMPDSLLRRGKILTVPFLQSSKAMLRLYEEYDLEQPDSSSITIRIWHSGALQNTTGKAGAAWHHHSEASLLALRLHLYDERAVARESTVESRLLRANFWLLYLADKAAEGLENRTPILIEHLFGSNLTLLEYSEEDEPLLDESRDTAQGGLEERLSVGFRLKTRIWAAAAGVITEIKAHVRRRELLGDTTGSQSSDIAHIAELNLRFTALLYELPPWLQLLANIDASKSSVDRYQTECLWTLKSNIMTTYHCLRLVILQRCVETDTVEVLGLTRQPLALAMRKLEIVQDFIGELELVPFLCYKVQGEAGVERIRRVGIHLLQLVQSAENSTIKDRAKSRFAHLLDYLARLDSRASDELSKVLL